MGFSKPPKPPALAPAPKAVEADNTVLTEERSRRQRASGTSGNVISSLRDSISDSSAGSSISKLLG